jgi:hypothetical protein
VSSSNKIELKPYGNSSEYRAIEVYRGIDIDVIYCCLVNPTSKLSTAESLGWRFLLPDASYRMCKFATPEEAFLKARKIVDDRLRQRSLVPADVRAPTPRPQFVRLFQLIGRVITIVRQETQVKRWILVGLGFTFLIIVVALFGRQIVQGLQEQVRQSQIDDQIRQLNTRRIASLTDQGGQTAHAVAAAKGFNDISELLRHASAPSGTPEPVASPSANPEATSPATPVANAAGGASVTGKIRIEEVQEAFLPVTLDKVHGKKATLRSADGSTYTVTVGDALKGTSYRVVDVEARTHNNKDRNVVHASVVKLRHERTGQTISLIKGVPTREHGAYVILVLNPTGQKIKVKLDHDFSLPDEPNQTYRVLDIRRTQVVIKRMSDGEVCTLQNVVN